MDIHNYKRRLENTLRNVNNSEISKNNKETIIKFHNFCFSEGISVCKIERYLFDLHKFTKILDKDLSKATKLDIQRVIAEVEKGAWSPHTKHSFKVMVKKFYRWVAEIDEKRVYPENVRWIKTGVKNSHQKLPEDLVTESEVSLMIKNVGNYRDKALISLLWESGCRIGEIGSMKLKDVNFDEYGAKINLSGKTGSRRIRIVNSTPYLQEWLNIHPKNDNPNSYIWMNQKGEPLSHNRFCTILKRSAEKSSIKKRIHPHGFRHARATFLAGHLTEAQMKDFLGWTQSSKMAGIYVHMSGRDTDNAILKLSGIKIEENEEEEKLKNKICVRCKTINQTTNRFCKLCGFILDKEEANKIIKEDIQREQADEVMNKLLRDPEILSLIKKKLSN